MTRDEHLAAAEEILKVHRGQRGDAALAAFAQAQLHLGLAAIADDIAAESDEALPYRKALKVIEALGRSHGWDQFWTELSATEKAEAIGRVREVIAP